MTALIRLHDDESGMETLEVVGLLSVAAVVLIFCRLLWTTKIKPWFRHSVQVVVEWQGEGP